VVAESHIYPLLTKFISYIQTKPQLPVSLSSSVIRHPALNPVDQYGPQVRPVCRCHHAAAAEDLLMPPPPIVTDQRAAAADDDSCRHHAGAIFAVPATSAPSERVFSVAGLVLQVKRSSLAPKNVNKIIFVHNNGHLLHRLHEEKS